MIKLPNQVPPFFIRTAVDNINNLKVIDRKHYYPEVKQTLSNMVIITIHSGKWDTTPRLNISWDPLRKSDLKLQFTDPDGEFTMIADIDLCGILDLEDEMFLMALTDTVKGFRSKGRGFSYALAEVVQDIFKK